MGWGQSKLKRMSDPKAVERAKTLSRQSRTAFFQTESRMPPVSRPRLQSAVEFKN